jgi:hypothetical protein
MFGADIIKSIALAGAHQYDPLRRMSGRRCQVQDLTLGADEAPLRQGAAHHTSGLLVSLADRPGKDRTFKDDEGERRLFGDLGTGRDELDVHANSLQKQS